MLSSLSKTREYPTESLFLLPGKTGMSWYETAADIHELSYTYSFYGVNIY